MRKFSEFSGVIDLISTREREREIGVKVLTRSKKNYLRESRMKIYDTNPDSFFKLFLLQFTYIFTSFFSRFATLADARIDKIDSALQAVPKESGIAIVFPRLGCLGSIFHRITVNDVSSRWNAVGSVVARSIVVTDRRHVSVKSGEERTRSTRAATCTCARFASR